MTITDVFVRSFYPADLKKADLRRAMRDVCEARWSVQRDASVRYLGGTLPSFNMDGKRIAEESATTDIYIIADDDCLILGADFVSRGTSILRGHPEFGLLTAISVIENHSDFVHTEDAVERHSVGGVAFVRRGILTEFPACPVEHTDETICAEFTRKGFKTGIMPSVRMNHLGYGYSITSDAYWWA